MRIVHMQGSAAELQYTKQRHACSCDASYEAHTQCCRAAQSPHVRCAACRRLWRHHVQHMLFNASCSPHPVLPHLGQHNWQTHICRCTDMPVLPAGAGLPSSAGVAPLGGAQAGCSADCQGGGAGGSNTGVWAGGHKSHLSTLLRWLQALCIIRAACLCVAGRGVCILLYMLARLSSRWHHGSLTDRRSWGRPRWNVGS